jgi:uncharacterized protein YggE
MENLWANFKVAAVVLAIIATIVAIGIASSWTTHGKPGTISVTASGTAYADEEAAAMYLTVNGTGNSAQSATANITSTLNSVNMTVSPFINGNMSKMKTVSYNIGRSYNASRNQTIYTATENIEISPFSASNVSGLIGALSRITGVYINSVYGQLANSQVASLRAQALSLALQNATTQAQEVAGPGAQVYIGNITVQNSYFYPGPLVGYSRSGVGATQGPIFSSGEGSVTESISTQFYYYK